MSKRQLKQAIESITEQEFEQELQRLSQSNQLQTDLHQIIDGMNEREVDQGIRKYGGAQAFVDALVSFLVFKGLLIKRGIQVGVAAGAGAVLIFGAGSLCQEVAAATGIGALDQIGEGMEVLSEFSMDVAEAGFEIAEEGIDFFGELIGGVAALFGF